MSASTGFYHGVKTNQLPTAIVPPRTIMSALPIVFGCAPIHRLPADMQAKVAPGKIIMIHDVAEAGALLGIDVQRDGFEHWTLSEMVYSYFVLFSAAPVVFANLFDPAKHRKSAVLEPVAFTAGKGRLAWGDLVEALVLTPVGGGDPFVPGVDYIANTITGEITVLEDGAMATLDQAAASYSFKPKTWGAIDVDFFVNNLFNAEYVANGWTDKWIEKGELTYAQGFFPQATRNFMVRLGVKF